ncbi:MAG: 6-phospho-beta-glucosidase [Sarcina sp.]
MIKEKIKIVAIGGGSSYTPELIDGFIKRANELPIDEIALVDIEEGKEKLNIVGKLAQRMVQNAGLDWKISITLNRKEALKNADFVCTQLRVGLLDARIKDERIPLSYGILGQETNGAGGIFKALRTIPVILDIVDDMKNICPNAWLVNFTNPAGMVTEAVIKYGKYERVVGLCNVPIGHINSEAKLINKKPEDIVWQFAGLNHFNWHKAFDKKGYELTEQIFDAIESNSESVVKNIADTPFNSKQIRDLKMLPCGYHKYYYLQDEMLQAAIDEFKKGETRAEVVKKVESELFELYKDVDLKVKPVQLEQRGGAHYSDAACELICAIFNDKRSVMVVNTKNNGAIADLPYDCAVEISSMITGKGPIPVTFGHFDNPAQRGQIQLMKSMEELVIEAAITGSYDKVLQAFTINPLIPSGIRSEKVLNELLVAHKKYLSKFLEKINELEINLK